MTTHTGVTVAELRAVLALLPDDGRIVLHGDDYEPTSLEVEEPDGRHGWVVLHNDHDRRDRALWRAAERALPTGPLEVCS